MSTLDKLLRLVRNTATLRQMQTFLQERSLPSSAQSWDSMMEDRVLPAIDKGLVIERDLTDFLSEVEEFGTQHIFLYRRKKGSDHGLPDDRDLRTWLRGLHDEAVLDAPRILEYPAKPTIAQIRRETDKNRRAIVIKAIETRIVTTLIGEEERANDKFVRFYQREPVRAVNIARLDSDGLLEIRIYSHRGPSHNYRADVDGLWSKLSGVLDPTKFSALSIMRTKQALWEQRNSLGSRIRFSNAELRNDQGTLMACNTGSPQSTLWDDASADAGLSAFMKEGDAYCETHNVWWLRQKDLPSRDVHVLLAGAVNEFTITQQCSRDDYEYVLADIRRLNN